MRILYEVPPDESIVRMPGFDQRQMVRRRFLDMRSTRLLGMVYRHGLLAVPSRVAEPSGRYTSPEIVVGKRPFCLLVVALIVLGAITALVPLAHASPPDPVWIDGCYDIDDHDEIGSRNRNDCSPSRLPALRARRRAGLAAHDSFTEYGGRDDV